MTSRLKIYLAGKFVRDAGETTRNDWRYHLGMHAEGSARCLRSLSVPLKGLPFDGVGPFFVGMKAHEAWAGHDLAGSDGNMLMQVDVSELVQAWIKRCDVFFAWLDADADAAYGTILEIGYAKALRKPIVVALGPSFPERFGLTNGVPFDECDQWLALSFADRITRAPRPMQALLDLAASPHMADVRSQATALRALAAEKLSCRRL